MSQRRATTDDTPHVVLAESNQLVGTVAARILTEGGYWVTHVRTGEEAIAELRRGGHDLLITAWELAGDMSGADVCAALRGDPVLTGTQIVMLTGHADIRHQVAALDAGADDFVAKPFEPEVLLARVRACLRVVRMETERNSALEDLRRREAAYREIAQEQASLRRVTATVAAAGSSDEVFVLVAREAAHVLGCEVGIVVHVVDHHDAQVVGVHAARGAHVAAAGHHVPVGDDSMLARIVRAAGPTRVSRGASDTGPWVAAVGAPIWLAGDLWGCVAALTRDADSLTHAAEARVGRFAELVSLAIANAQNRQKIADLAMHDALTGLPNRRAFEDAMERALALAARTGNPLSLAIMDIDHFKRVNDDHGHDVGDQVLSGVSQRLASVARTEEPVARLGGEEFAWILPNTTALQALVAAERARAAVATTPFTTVGHVTVSIGIADLDAAGSGDALFRMADQALYAAKAEGRNRCHVARTPSPVG